MPVKALIYPRDGLELSLFNDKDDACTYCFRWPPDALLADIAAFMIVIYPLKQSLRTCFSTQIKKARLKRRAFFRLNLVTLHDLI